jgi:hypothetical protein
MALHYQLAMKYCEEFGKMSVAAYAHSNQSINQYSFISGMTNRKPTSINNNYAE